MYTRCPHCRTCFVVSAAQLSAAKGQVRCGHCLSVFDGLRFLADGLPDAAATGTATEASDRDELGYDPRNRSAAVDPASGDAAVQKDEPPTLDADLAGTEADHVPEVLKEDLARAESELRARARSWIYTLAGLLLLAALGAQYAWFKPAGLLAGYPQARPLLEKFCAATGCSLPDRSVPSKIQMLARDVRVHPKYEGALLVSATLVNVAPHPQPYPRIRFSVFNVNGQTTASRTFEPQEYLSSNVDAAGEMVPGKPLQITVELVAPEEAAVSYEFRFL